jgi:hypothetical protein
MNHVCLPFVHPSAVRYDRCGGAQTAEAEQTLAGNADPGPGGHNDAPSKIMTANSFVLQRKVALSAQLSQPGILFFFHNKSINSIFQPYFSGKP